MRPIAQSLFSFPLRKLPEKGFWEELQVNIPLLPFLLELALKAALLHRLTSRWIITWLRWNMHFVRHSTVSPEFSQLYSKPRLTPKGHQGSNSNAVALGSLCSWAPGSLQSLTQCSWALSRTRFYRKWWTSEQFPAWQAYDWVTIASRQVGALKQNHGQSQSESTPGTTRLFLIGSC